MTANLVLIVVVLTIPIYSRYTITIFFCLGNLLSDAKRHTSLLPSFLISNLLYVGVDEIIGFKKLVGDLDMITIPNVSRQHSKSSFFLLLNAHFTMFMTIIIFNIT